MLELHTDYFSLKDQEASTELYYWEDVLRVAYYIHRDSMYYRTSDDTTLYLIIEHECGDYLRIPQGSSEWDILEQNLHQHLPIIPHQRKELLKNAPIGELIAIFVRENT